MNRFIFVVVAVVLWTLSNVPCRAIVEELAPVFYKGMSQEYFADLKQDSKSALKSYSVYTDALIIYNLITEMKSLSPQEKTISLIMQKALKLKADSYYMFYEFMLSKAETPEAISWITHYTREKLRWATAEATRYANMILADYLRSLSKTNAASVPPREQIRFSFAIAQILAYEAENNSVLSLLSKEELQRLKEFCNTLNDPMNWQLSLFLDEYGKETLNVTDLFKRYYPSVPYPTTDEEVLDVALGLRLTIYKILLLNDIDSNEAKVWHKWLYDGEPFFGKFSFYKLSDSF